ncbi:type II toxin-antitoxin system VapC family toxin [Rhizobium sp. TH2]|uniref:type II toxin-antitoxin system VapC family toxin n=1 Tax=Rhizobium sp. TH2 TaxID=2775403 RepID=UPI0021583CA7|nr:type II toxin-antitoxin system VapC family toxin [Rhizobium sp. TH2]UVC10647.1 type II toxin-antitoxin system VapC family toxin [Rhizobium sp. TH2]
MFLDASVLVAIFNEEADGAALELRIADLTSPTYISPMVKFEAAMAIARSNWERNGETGQRRAVLMAEASKALERYLAEIGVRELPITPAIGDGALHAAATFGKVVGHKAALNMGDCFSYACAKAQNVPLLYKGNDFSQTDLA